MTSTQSAIHSITWNKSREEISDITKLTESWNFCFKFHDLKDAKAADFIASGLLVVNDKIDPKKFAVIRDSSISQDYLTKSINTIETLYLKNIGPIEDATVIRCSHDVFGKLKAQYESKASTYAATIVSEADVSTVKKAENLLFAAKKLKTSDIHFIVEGSNVLVRFRIYKELHTYCVLPMDEAVSIAQVFFITFTRGSDSSEAGTGDGQYKSTHLKEGEFTRRHSETGESISARLLNLGQAKGDLFNVVLRLIDNSKDPKPESFEKLNFSPAACEKLSHLNLITRGLILVCGVTNSGKSHTVQNMVMLNNARTGGTQKTYMLEQPIERMMNNVTHINVADTKHGNDTKVGKESDFSLENLNRLLMRGDPNNIGYGELRDEATTSAACHGVGSGHLVYGTLHLDSAIGVFARLESFKANRNILFHPSFLKLVLFQALVPTLCPHCSISYKIGSAMPPEMSDLQLLKAYKGAGHVSMGDIERAQSARRPGESIIRAAQRLNIISSKDAATLLADKKIMGFDTEDHEFKERLNTIIRLNSSIPKDKINIRLRGDGCSKCRQGTNGIQPASEILMPDKTFLSLMEKNQYERAENYWISNLKGFSIIEDTFERILTGVFDPRIVERELGMLTQSLK